MPSCTLCNFPHTSFTSLWLLLNGRGNWIVLNKLQHAWYGNSKWVWCLVPFTVLFWLLSACRRWLYAAGILASTDANIAIVVVGNISIGGNGKTPLVLALVKELRARGYNPAVVSRGYGGAQTSFPYLVQNTDAASLVGDEPALIVQRMGVALVIDPVRARAIDFIQQHTQANVVICDDGLQHYAMKRDCELCVLDHRGIGNGFLLPMGPLREGPWRLDKVNAIINNMGFAALSESTEQHRPYATDTFNMALKCTVWVNVLSGEVKSLADFSECIGDDLSEISAVAGIGEPKRFFDTLTGLNINPKRLLAFADHHQFIESDIPAEGFVLMTEKDAVKCMGFTHKHMWYLQIEAHLPDEFYTLIEAAVQAKTARVSKSRA